MLTTTKQLLLITNYLIILLILNILAFAEGNQIIEVGRGERITSEMIEDVKEDRKRTRIKICNYGIYQGSENNERTTNEQRANNEQTTSKHKQE